MTETIFDHDRLDVYRLAVEYTAESKRTLQRIVSMLTRMAMKSGGVAETSRGIASRAITSTSTAALSTSTRRQGSQNKRSTTGAGVVQKHGERMTAPWSSLSFYDKAACGRSTSPDAKGL